MIVVELIVLVAVIFAGVLALRAMNASIVAWRESRSLREQRRKDMQGDIRSALASRDHRRVSDVLVVWADELPKETQSYLQVRRDEMYVDSDGGPRV